MPFTANPFDDLKNAAQYLKRFRQKTFVVKVGGEILDEPKSRRAVCEQLALLWTLSIRLVVVHGGGKRLDEVCNAMQLPIEKVAGRRVTSAAVLDAAKMVFAGSSQLDLISELQSVGLNCVGLTGVDAGLVQGHRRPVVNVAGHGEVDYGYVGEVDAVQPRLLHHLLSGDFVPVIAPLTAGIGSEVFNTNADTVAAHIAAALGAEKLVFVQGAPGLLSDPGNNATLISYCKLDRLDALSAAGALRDGMLPKASAIRLALDGGVSSVHLISGRQPDSLLQETFTNEGCGTMIVKRSPGDTDAAA